MREFGAFEVKTRLASLLDLVERGEEVAITRRGRRVARLVPDSDRTDSTGARQAARDILERSRGITLGGLRTKDLVDAGRP